MWSICRSHPCVAGKHNLCGLPLLPHCAQCALRCTAVAIKLTLKLTLYKDIKLTLKSNPCVGDKHNRCGALALASPCVLCEHLEIL